MVFDAVSAGVMEVRCHALRYIATLLFTFGVSGERVHPQSVHKTVDNVTRYALRSVHDSHAARGLPFANDRVGDPSRNGFGSGYRYGDPSTPFLFPGQQGGSITPGAVGRILKRNLGGLRGHSLRHRFATTVHDATGNTLAVQQLLGHSRAETTSIYVRVTERALRDVVECA